MLVPRVIVELEMVRPSQAPESKGRQMGGKITILSENCLFYMLNKTEEAK
jgi:hypothetical protein